MGLPLRTPEYFNIVEQGRYCVTITAPKNIEDLDDSFITLEELKALTGRDNFYFGAKDSEQVLVYHELIESDLTPYIEALDASPKRSITIKNDELVVVLMNARAKGLGDYVGYDYCRHGNRIRYSVSRKRKKVRATKGDARIIWGLFQQGFFTRYGCYLPHIPLWYRNVKLFNAYKKLVGWKACRKHMHKDNVKFYREIWDNPKEFINE